MSEKPYALGNVNLRSAALFVYRLNLEYDREWDGRHYGIQQVAPIVAEEEDRLIVVTVYTFYFQEGQAR